jgi:hypothetical protein
MAWGIATPNGLQVGLQVTPPLPTRCA